QAQEASEISGRDRGLAWKVSQEVCKLYSQADPNWTPAYMTTLAHQVAKRVLENEDIFLAQKRYYNRMALDLYPRLKDIVEKSTNRLETALRIAIAGNIIDLGVYREVKVDEILSQIEHTPWGIYQFEEFKMDLEKANTLVYVGDNAGEVVFDRVLLEEIDHSRHILFIVKGGPISNDALLEDAREAGIDQVARIVTTGQAEIGISLEKTSSDVQSFWKRADLIISKGQGNYETLSDHPENIYFLLKAKCIPVARELGVPQGSLILKKR
ncbi:MAG: ARMT1-like domain-containing protein, partial [Atribacterota bacterium]